MVYWIGDIPSKSHMGQELAQSERSMTKRMLMPSGRNPHGHTKSRGKKGEPVFQTSIDSSLSWPSKKNRILKAAVKQLKKESK